MVQDVQVHESIPISAFSCTTTPSGVSTPSDFTDDDSLTINVIPTNNLPVFMINETDACAANYTEETDTPVNVINGGFTLTDADEPLNGSNYQSITVMVTNNMHHSDTFTYNIADLPQASVDRSVAGRLVVNFGAIPGTLMNVTYVLDRIQFFNSDPGMTAFARTVTITITDIFGGAGSANTTICICPFNDPPAIYFVSHFGDFSPMSQFGDFSPILSWFVCHQNRVYSGLYKAPGSCIILTMECQQ